MLGTCTGYVQLGNAAAATMSKAKNAITTAPSDLPVNATNDEMHSSETSDDGPSQVGGCWYDQCVKGNNVGLESRLWNYYEWTYILQSNLC